MAVQSQFDLPMPFLTLPDPAVSGEGQLDPLGLAVVGDRLADWILPGMTARMHRPRFLTAMALSATVCEDLENEISADRVSPAHLIFEWLVLEAFAREGNPDDVQGTPGILKAKTAKQAGLPLCARNYLKTALVMGFHGVYGRLARHLGIVDDDYQLGENGHALAKMWEQEELSQALAEWGGKQVLREAVRDGLKEGCTTRSAGWQGWTFLAQHICPAKVGARESDLIYRLLLDGRGETRGEIFRFFTRPEMQTLREDFTEAELVEDVLMPSVSPELAVRPRTIVAYERFCAVLEGAFDWLRYLASANALGARALSQSEYTSSPAVGELASELPRRVDEAETMLAEAPPRVFQEFGSLHQAFAGIHRAEELFDAILERHANVQRHKPPDGKREWFERGKDAGVFIRVPYRLMERPEAVKDWPRPYRVRAVRSFCQDLQRGSRNGSP
jgi:hypothetical protein